MTNENYLTLSQVRSHVPGARSARSIATSTITRWILNGCRSRSGKRVKLTATRAGGRWLVKQSDLDAFFAALDDAYAEQPAAVPSAPKVDAARAAAAAKELARRGF